MIKTALGKLKKICTNLYASEKFLILLCFLILLVLNFIRLSNVGEDAYYYNRIADNLFSNPSVLFHDGLNSGGEVGFGVLLGLFSFLNVGIVSKILMIIFGVLSFILFYKIIKDKFEKKTRIIISLFLLLSPTFLYLFSVNGSYSVAMFLSLTTLYFLNKKKIVSYISLALLPFFSVGFFICSLLFVLIYSSRKRDYYFLSFSVLLMILTSFIYKPSSFVFSKLDSMFFIFGNTFGLSLFVFILSLFGLFYLFKELKRKKLIYIYLSFILFYLINYFFSYFIFYFNFLVSILGGYGFIKLFERKWESSDIKKWMVFIVICSVLFSGLSFFGWYARAMPTEEIINGLLFLKDKENGVVFSDISRGVWINSIADKENVVDKFTRNKTKIEDVQKFLYGINEKEIDYFIAKYHIKYVFIDKEMKDKLWKNDEEGLLYVLKFGKKFKRVYNEDNVEIWKHI